MKKYYATEAAREYQEYKMAKIFARIQRPSLRYGLIFGLILGVVQIIYGFATSFITDANAQSYLSTIGLALFLVFGILAGRRAAQETGKLGTGALAGLWAGLIGSAVEALLPLINTFIFLQSILDTTRNYIKTHPSQHPGLKPSDYTASDVIVGTLISLLFYILFYTLITLIGGALGGYLGRRSALLASQTDGGYEATPSSSASDEVAADEATK